MLPTILCVLVFIMSTVFIIGSIQEYAKTKDNAYVVFCAMFTAVWIGLIYGLMHFKPWLN